MHATVERDGLRIPVLTLSILAALGGGAGAAQAQEQDALEEVVVTGSRILRRDFSAPSPIMTVDSDTLSASSTTSVESVLNQFPQFVPTGTQFQTGDIEPSAFETPGISNVNLRGLGSNRNLVLVNGRRMQPANALLIVDVGTIPSAAIANVEAITGGASAVYGADAISGVVNFILRDDFEGLNIDVQTGGAAEGDGEETRFSMLYGGNLDNGRGNIMLGVEWSDRNPVRNIDRDFIREGWLDPGSSTGTGNIAATYWNPPNCGGFAAAGCPDQDVVDQVFADAGPPGTANRGNNFFVHEDGTVFQDVGAVGYEGPLGGDSFRKIRIFNNDTLGQVNPTTLLSSALERHNVFGRAVYDLNDNIRAFAQATFSQHEVRSTGPWALAIGSGAVAVPYGTDLHAPSLMGDGTTHPDYLPGGRYDLNCAPTGGCTQSEVWPVPEELGMLLDSRGTPNADWQLERYLDFLPSRQTHNESTVWQLQAGLEGSLPNRDWTWEAYVSQGRTRVDSLLDGGWLSQGRWFSVVQSPNYGRNAELSGGNGTSGMCTSGIPFFDDFPISDDCVDAMEVRLKQVTRLEQTIVEANLQGGIVDMPAGELRFAAGVSRRENTARFEPDTLADQQSTADNVVGLFAMNETQGEDKVEEIYGELLIPVVERLNFEVGYRYSDYERTGSVETHKALFDWAATDSFRLRGGRQVANRAPNIAEQFTGPSRNVVPFPGSDPCASDTANPWGNVPGNPDRDQVQELCSAIIGNTTSDWHQDPDNFVGPFGFFQLETQEVVGNPDVNSEEAETYTVGAVIERDAWSLSVDYYTMDIQGAIESPSPFVTYSQCFNANGSSNPTYSLDDPGGFCRTIQRDEVSGWRAGVIALYTNLGALETDGVDTQFNWRGDIGGNPIFVNTIVSAVNSYKIQPAPGGEFFEYAGTLGAGGQFDYRMYTTFGYDVGPTNLGLRWIHLPEVEHSSYAENPDTNVLPTKSYNRFDLFGNWQISDNVNLRFGIDNLLDTDPEIVGREPGVNNALGSTNAGYYDVLGRRYYAGMRFTF